jgi:hypothetical protein
VCTTQHVHAHGCMIMWRRKPFSDLHPTVCGRSARACTYTLNE